MLISDVILFFGCPGYAVRSQYKFNICRWQPRTGMAGNTNPLPYMFPPIRINFPLAQTVIALTNCHFRTLQQTSHSLHDNK